MPGRTTTVRGDYRKTILPNGLRIITEKVPAVRSVSIGAWIDVGSRNELTELNGVTHFIEHMVFKGTRRRTARQIAAELESRGGSLNAFTSRETTCFAARILDEHLEEAVDVLADITCQATFTPVNILREKMVICEEIKEAEENPSDHIHDLFARAFWGSHPLGQPILGTKDTVTGFKRRQVIEYLRRHYRCGSVVIAAAGRISHTKLVRLVRERFSFPEGEAQRPERASRRGSPNVQLSVNSNDQTHLCLGFPGMEYGASNKMAVLALNVYLGAGMSSVLFQKIREEKGLAYVTYTFHDFYRDAGVFGAYLGTDKKHLRQAVDIILKELHKLKKKKLSRQTLDTIRGQMKGQLALGMESTASRMNRLARQELMLGGFQSYKRMLKEVDKVTPSQILEAANRIFDDAALTIAVLGPVDKRALEHVL